MTRYRIGWALVVIAIVAGLVFGPEVGVVASAATVVAIFIMAALTLPDDPRPPRRR